MIVHLTDHEVQSGCIIVDTFGTDCYGKPFQAGSIVRLLTYDAHAEYVYWVERLLHGKEEHEGLQFAELRAINLPESFEHNGYYPASAIRVIHT